MTNAQIRTLLNKGYSAEHIANYGQCSMEQVERVADTVCVYCSTPVPASDLICSDQCQRAHYGMTQ